MSQKKVKVEINIPAREYELEEGHTIEDFKEFLYECWEEDIDCALQDMYDYMTVTEVEQ